MYRTLSTGALVLVSLLASLSADQARSARGQDRSPAILPTTWRDARPIVERLEDTLPESLRSIPRDQRESRWPQWIDGQRRALAARIARGDLDSVVNLLLFGTSFTRQPRITIGLLSELNERWNTGDRSAQETLARHYQQRAADLVDAARRAGADGHLQDARRVLTSRGHNLDTPAGHAAAIQDLLANVARVRDEAARLAHELAAQRSADSTTSFAERSRIFRDRGLSADSSVLTQFAIDRAIYALRDGGVLTARSVNRVAIVGPGLDFVDKQEGFDFYEPQTLQPFTFADSLLRCGLADRSAVTVTTLDVSPRVNGHLRAAVRRATDRRDVYRLILPWNSGHAWSSEATEYWKRAGAQVGRAFAVPAPRNMPGVLARGVAISPDIVRRVHPVEASIVSDRLELKDEQRFDLVLASNVLVYYDTFEQTLALASIAAMLQPGGVLLTNDAVLEIPEVPLRSRGTLAVPFSARPGDGERMVWYVKAAEKR